MIAKHLLHGDGLELGVHLGRSAVRINVIDLFRSHTGIGKGPLHCPHRPFAFRVWLRDMMCIARCTVTDKLRHNLRTALLSMIERLQDQ